ANRSARMTPYQPDGLTSQIPARRARYGGPVPCPGYRSRTAAIVAQRVPGRAHPRDSRADWYHVQDRPGSRELRSPLTLLRTDGITCTGPPRYAALLEESAQRRGMSVRAWSTC